MESLPGGAFLYKKAAPGPPAKNFGSEPFPALRGQVRGAGGAGQRQGGEPGLARQFPQGMDGSF